jgi:transposase
MSQLHKRLTDEQIRAFFQSYCQGTLSRKEIQDVVEISKTRFFALLKVYREDPQNFTVAYKRETPAKLSAQAEAKIENALLKEKKIVEDPDLPISGYNYSAIRDRLKKEGVQVSVPTIINRAR